MTKANSSITHMRILYFALSLAACAALAHANRTGWSAWTAMFPPSFVHREGGPQHK